MKKLLSILIMSAAALISCQQKTKVATVDVNAVKAAVTEVIDKQNEAAKAHDAKAYVSFMIDDAVLVGTDPKELWTKAQTLEMISQMMSDTTMKLDLKPEKREIIVSPDGNSAIVMDQMFVSFISTKVQLRRICHLVKTDGGWMINFDSTSMIPKNEDLPVIDKALE